MLGVVQLEVFENLGGGVGRGRSYGAYAWQGEDEDEIRIPLIDNSSLWGTFVLAPRTTSDHIQFVSLLFHYCFVSLVKDQTALK